MPRSALFPLRAALLLTPLAPALAQQTSPAPRAEVLVLGSYHMANPGHDIFNLQADDVLTPKRQAEIAEVIAVLRKFNPTKIAVERGVGDTRITKDYADYLAGTHELTRNEIEQLGFRLAKALGHKSVYPVDVDGEFPFQHVVNYAKASGKSQDLDATMAGFGEHVKALNQYLPTHTVLEALRLVNSDANAADEVGLYFRQAHFGEAWDWAGADLVAEWFKRNVRIFSNVARLVDGPAERILVIYGYGHLGWLQQCFASDPTFRLRKLAEFVQ